MSVSCSDSNVVPSECKGVEVPLSDFPSVASMCSHNSNNQSIPNITIEEAIDSGSLSSQQAIGTESSSRFANYSQSSLIEDYTLLLPVRTSAASNVGNQEHSFGSDYYINEMNKKEEQVETKPPENVTNKLDSKVLETKKAKDAEKHKTKDDEKHKEKDDEKHKTKDEEKRKGKEGRKEKDEEKRKEKRRA